MNSMDIRFNVWRQTPATDPYFQTFILAVEPGQTILDCLHRIKWEQDGTLAFRKNCRNTICGSCAMRINGRATLACKENIGGELARLRRLEAEVPCLEAEKKQPEMTIAPLGNLPVIKDLVVDMASFWQHLDAVKPFVDSSIESGPFYGQSPGQSSAFRMAERASAPPVAHDHGESRQSPAERAHLNPMGNCILCAACYSECNAREVNPGFVGPHALAKAYRLVADSRDHTAPARLDQYNQGTQGVWGCTRCGYCDTVCPMEVAPLEQISRIKGKILRQSAQSGAGSESRSVRHRRVLINLVKQGGWIDERRFGVQVVGHSGRDLLGLLSLAPLGWRMVRAGKFPLGFEPSEGTDQVRSLIESVQAMDPSQRVGDRPIETPEPMGG
jgi:succinate dehydrogenase / fumarate reductase, iron-sulfur subunit